MQDAKNDVQAKPTPPRRRAWGLARGEGAIVSAGLTVAAIVVGVLAASAWWTLHTYRSSLERARREQIAVVSRLLANSAEALLAEGREADVRRLVSETAVRYGLRECSVVLTDGTVLADLDTSRIARKIPDSWPAGAAAPERVSAGEKGVSIELPIVAKGKGEASLVASAEVDYPIWADWEVQAGIGAIGVGAFAGLLVVYRIMRARWRTLGAVGDALRLEHSGRATQGSLWIADALGAEAKAWNTIIEERDRLREQAVLKAATEQLSQRGHRDGELTAACDALWQGLVVLDREGKIRYANGAAAVLLKAKRDELSGADVAAHLPEPQVSEALSAVLTGRSRTRSSLELSRTSASGEKSSLRVTVRPLRGEDGAAAVVVLEDVTQQRVADESRNAFVAQATHELRTPLTNIRLYLEMLLDEGESDPQTRAKCLNVIATESRRLERVVGDMLSVSEIEAGALKLRLGEVRTDAMFEELQADFSAGAKDKEIGLVFELPPKLPVLQADRDKLMLALHNLIGNAIKYTPAGGKVTVRVDVDNTALRVAVTDNGIGIKDDEHELIFERFYRAKDRRIAGITGSGIGLALARQVVRLHAGDISVASQIDKGSTFTLTVPLTQGAGARLAA